jgi:glycosyltransferase involved in cell wall biosynthesis
VVDEGGSGFIVDTVEEAIAAVRRLPELDRANVRAIFDRRFTADRMAQDYVDIYRRHQAAPPVWQTASSVTEIAADRR